MRLFRLSRFEDAERAGIEVAKNQVDLSKRVALFPSRLFLRDLSSGIKPEKTACSIPSSFGLAILTLIIISNLSAARQSVRSTWKIP
jgi:hypothetical protein